MLVGVGWLGRVAVSEHDKVFVKTPLNRAIAIYTAVCVFATLIGILVGRVRPMGGLFFLLKYYEYFFLFFMTVNLVKTPEQVRHLVTASLVTCFAVALYAISQIPSGMRVSAPFEGQEGEPNTLGGYLVFMMALIGGSKISTRTRIDTSSLLIEYRRRAGKMAAHSTARCGGVRFAGDTVSILISRGWSRHGRIRRRVAATEPCSGCIGPGGLYRTSRPGASFCG